jgi:hypothetical protein
MSDPDRAERVQVCDCPEYRYRVCDVCQCVTGVEVAAPIDWPARVKAADEVAVNMGWGHETHLPELARDLERMPSYVVEAIGRALLGEGEGQP